MKGMRHEGGSWNCGTTGNVGNDRTRVVVPLPLPTICVYIYIIIYTSNKS